MTSLKLAAALCVLFVVTGSSIAQTDNEFYNLFIKHGCTQERIDYCFNGIGRQPTCDAFKISSQCLFRECSAIKGTEDAGIAAAVIQVYSKANFGCDFDVIDLINGAPGSLHRQLKDVFYNLFIKHGCTQEGIDNCAISIGSQLPCDAVKISSQCLFRECYRIKGTEDAGIAAAAVHLFSKANFGCDFDVIELMNGAPGSLHRPLIDEVYNLFIKHGCTQESIDLFANIIGSQPPCDAVKRSAQYLFRECSGIKGTEDAEIAAAAVHLYSKATFGCDFDVIELKNGAPGSLHRPVTAVLVLALAISFFKLFFY